jgi:hypothetical protein
MTAGLEVQQTYLAGEVQLNGLDANVLGAGGHGCGGKWTRDGGSKKEETRRMGWVQRGGFEVSSGYNKSVGRM